MTKLARHVPRAPPEWRVIVTRIREQHWTDTEQKEISVSKQSHNGIEDALEAMLHWRDPVERLRFVRCRRRSLIDDNPCSG
jgi:hypothetical protein